MDTRAIEAAVSTATRGSPPARQAPAPNPPPASPVKAVDEAAQNGYKVSISTQPGGGAMETHGILAQANKEVNASIARVREKKAEENDTAQMEAQYAQFNTNLQRNYSVEANRRVVMRVTHRGDDTLVKEVPSREDRHVRDAMVEYVKSDGKLI